MENRARVLELRNGPAGIRHYLADRLLNGGDPIQLCFSGGWVTGRYERSSDHPERAFFHCSIERAGGMTTDHMVELPDDALVRWP